MNKDLIKLLLTRYWKVILALVVIVLGLHLMTTVESITRWQEDYQSAFGSVENRKDTIFEADEDGQYYQMNYDGPEEDNTTTDYETFRDFQLTFFIEGAGSSHLGLYTRYPSSYYYSEPSDIYFLLTILIGFGLFFFDLKTNFNTLLFSNRFSKKQLYWHKHLLVGGSLLLSLLLGKVITILGLWTGISHTYLNSSLGTLVMTGLLTVIVLMTLYAISSLSSLLLGEWLTAIITLVGFLWTLPTFFINLTNLARIGYYYLTGTKLINPSFQSPMNYLIFELTSVRPPLGIFILLLVILLVCLLVGSFWFPKTSLEANGKYLLFDQLRQPTLWFFIFYSDVVLTGSYWALPLNAVGEVIAQQPTLSRVLVVTLVAYLVGQLVIYRKIPLIANVKQRWLARSLY